MHTLAQKPGATHKFKTANSIKPSWPLSKQNRDVDSVLLRHTIGNQATQRLLQTNSEGLHAESATTASTRFGHDFSRIPIFNRSPLQVQPNLTVGVSADTAEQEADRVADQVVRMPEPQLQLGRPYDRGCAKCQVNQLNPERLLTKRVQASDLGKNAAPPIVHEALAKPGQPLDAATRVFMELRFGQDFSSVRLHTDSVAVQAAKLINAKAFTAGRDIVFGAGHFNSEGRDGRQLLAHELTHVLQQRNSPTPQLARKVDVPAVDHLLKRALATTLTAKPELSATTATYFYKADDVEPSYEVSDPAITASGGSSKIHALLRTFRLLHWSILRHLNRVSKRESRITEPPPGEVKVALDDAPDDSARRIIELTARDLGWTIEVLTPILGREVGRAAVDKAMAEKRLNQISLTTFDEINPKKVKARKLGGFGSPPCIPIPPHKIRWVIGSAGLHIDAGGTGKKIASGSSLNIGYEDANNLNLAATEAPAGGKAMKIPNLVCGNITDAWPIGDNRADLITTHSAPINAKEIARVIKPNGRIFLTGPEVNGNFQDVLQELANRRKHVDEINATEDVDHPKQVDRIDIQLSTNVESTEGKKRTMK